jgi:hypothetical protein
MKTPAIIGIAAVSAAAILSAAGVTAVEISHSHATPVAATAPAPKSTTIIKKKVIHKTVIVPAAPAPVAPQSGPMMRSVGNGIFANANTSDAFAVNVADSWNGYEGTQEVYSPVTGQTYAMTYTMSGPSTVLATGGNNVYVTFPG